MEKLENVLTQEPLIREAYILLREVRFFLGDFSIPIKVKLYRIVGDDNVMFDQSHYIQTPQQAGPHMTDRDFGYKESDALSTAIGTITSFYMGAVEAGETPSDDWLVENKAF